MTDQIRDLFQNFIAPQLEAIKDEIQAVEAKTSPADPKLKDHYQELNERVENLRNELQTISNNVSRLDQKLDLAMASITDSLFNLRRELLPKK